MKIDFEIEISTLTPELKGADGYLNCEHVIVTNIKKHVRKGVAIPVIETYLKKLLVFFEDKMLINKGHTDSVNFRYAAGFLNSVISTPYWHSWMKVGI